MEFEENLIKGVLGNKETNVIVTGGEIKFTLNSDVERANKIIQLADFVVKKIRSDQGFSKTHIVNELEQNGISKALLIEEIAKRLDELENRDRANLQDLFNEND